MESRLASRAASPMFKLRNQAPKTVPKARRGVAKRRNWSAMLPLISTGTLVPPTDPWGNQRTPTPLKIFFFSTDFLPINLFPAKNGSSDAPRSHDVKSSHQRCRKPSRLSAPPLQPPPETPGTHHSRRAGRAPSAAPSRRRMSAARPRPVAPQFSTPEPPSRGQIPALVRRS